MSNFLTLSIYHSTIQPEEAHNAVAKIHILKSTTKPFNVLLA